MLDALRHTLGGRQGQVLLGITLLLGLTGAVAVSAGTPSSQRSFAFTSLGVQLLMSVTVPFLGVLLTTPLRLPGPRGRLAPRLLAATAVAVCVAVIGVAISALALAVAPSTASAGGWQHAGAIVVGSVLVQVMAQLFGTGLGLLMSPPSLAMAATVVLPLALWWVLGVVDALQPAQVWLTPFSSAGHLLSGQMTPLNWAQAAVIVLIWDVGSNALGALRTRQHH